MQNLSMMSSQTSSLKITSPDSPIDICVSKNDPAQDASSFQNEFSKQVQSQKSQDSNDSSSNNSETANQSASSQPQGSEDTTKSKKQGNLAKAPLPGNLDPSLIKSHLGNAKSKIDSDSVTDQSSLKVTDKTDQTASGSSPLLFGFHQNMSLTHQPIKADSANPDDKGAKDASDKDSSSLSVIANDKLSSEKDAGKTPDASASSNPHSDWLESMLPVMNKKSDMADAVPDKLTHRLSTESVPQDLSVNLLGQSQASAQTNAIQASLNIPTTNSISAYPGKTGWDQAIGQKVIYMVGASEQTATLTLNPPDLGPLQVVISVNNDQANTTFISEHPEVRKALENGAATLRDMMDQAGIQLGQMNVSSGNQQQQQHFQQSSTHAMPTQNSTLSSSSKIEVPASLSQKMTLSNGLVDTFV